jgi:hypothetical protein
MDMHVREPNPLVGDRLASVRRICLGWQAHYLTRLSLARDYVSGKCLRSHLRVLHQRAALQLLD